MTSIKKNLMMITGLAVIITIFNGCTEGEIEYVKKVTSTAVKAYKNAKPEVREAYLSYKDGNITHDELRNVARKFGQEYLLERVTGAK